MNDYPQPWRKAEDGEYKTCKPIGEVCEICDHHGWPLMKCNNEQIRDGVLALAAENERLRALVKQQRKVSNRDTSCVSRPCWMMHGSYSRRLLVTSDPRRPAGYRRNQAPVPAYRRVYEPAFR
jgi:hypothetical protein